MATIYDVARTAGVSPKTVSRVLNGGTLVRESTREAVAAAMAELDYVPSSAARAMRSNRSGLVGLITNAISAAQERPDLTGLPDLVIVQAIQRRLEALGRTLLIADTGGEPARVASLTRTFAEHRVEGLLYVAPFHQEVTLSGNRDVEHTVIVNGYDAAGTPAVVPDEYPAQRALIERLIAIGHRRIAYLTLPTALVATRLRTAAYRDALAAAGIGFDPELLLAGDLPVQTLDEEARVQAEAIDRYLALPEPPTVICTGNDRMALRAYGLLRSRGLRVPDDVSVAGYDDHRLISETLYPALTTVELPYQRMGEAAVETLARLIGGTVPDEADAVRRAASLAAPPPTAAPVREAGLVRVTGELRWRDSVVPPSTDRHTTMRRPRS